MRLQPVQERVLRSQGNLVVLHNATCILLNAAGFKMYFRGEKYHITCKMQNKKKKKKKYNKNDIHASWLLYKPQALWKEYIL